ncbi:MAG: histidine phosphatase family protein [Actinomycetes bacterium]
MAKVPSCEVVLVRHAHSTANLKGILAGRDNRVGLSPRGKIEAEELATLLQSSEFDAIYSSPLRRCRETIAPLLARRAQKVEFLDGLIEMEYGRWSGKSLPLLAKEDLWKTIQSRPSTVRFPGGESFSEMSVRANQAVLAQSSGKRRILVVSHGDVIKSIVAFHLGLTLDLFQRIAIDPASVSTIRLPASQIIQVNSTAHLSRGAAGPKAKRDRFTLGGGEGRK